MYNGDILYAYISFIVDEFPDEESKYKIALVDHKQKVGNEEKLYKFNLKFHEKNKSIKFDNGELTVSPLGIRIYSKEKMDDIKIETINENSEGDVVIDTSKNIGIEGFGERGSNQSGYDSKFVYTFQWKEPKNICDLEYIKLNGEKFKLSIAGYSTKHE